VYAGACWYILMWVIDESKATSPQGTEKGGKEGEDVWITPPHRGLPGGGTLKKPRKQSFKLFVLLLSKYDNKSSECLVRATGPGTVRDCECSNRI
jgi:hypothetical protein